MLDIPAPTARGYVIVPAGAPEREVTAVNPEVPGPAGAMISTLEGPHAWATALVSRSLLSPASHTEQTTFVNANLSPVLRTGYGAGVVEIKRLRRPQRCDLRLQHRHVPAPGPGATIVVAAGKSTNVEGVGLDTVLQIAKLLHPARFPS
jgi:hypothetical protein